MDGEFSNLMAEIWELWHLAQLQIQNLLLPSRLWQLVILIGLIVAALLLNAWAQPRMREWMRGLTDRPTWQLRLLLTVNRG